MTHFTKLFSTFFIVLTLAFATLGDAEAKRFGGGGSFGGKSFYSKPYKRSTAPQPTRNAQQQQAYQQNQTARQSYARRGGLMGMLGALAIGGLLGSLLFGGAFEGLNLMDILVFAGIAYLLYRFFAAGKKQPQTAGYRTADYDMQSPYQREAQQQAPQSPASFETDVLFDKNKRTSAETHYGDTPHSDFESLVLPAGFDENDFLNGAENAFRMLQQAWDNNDLTTIRSLTTDKVFSEIQDQLRASSESNDTQILTLNSSLLDVRDSGYQKEATVLFDCLMREAPHEQASVVREVWHFIKLKSSTQTGWSLDGIQQLED